MNELSQHSLPQPGWAQVAEMRLPGVQPLDGADWLIVDEAFAWQMAEKERVLTEHRAEVLIERPEARPACAEMMDLILDHLGPGYRREAGRVWRPDGAKIDLGGEPLETAARLVQEDLCVLDRPKGGAQHILIAGALCFPASWRLAEKIGRPLTAIHAPVAEYDDAVARRVQRLFDHIRPNTPLWRQNALIYDRPDLFQPRSAADRRVPPDAGQGYLRSERQTLVRLPKTGAVVFTVHTYVTPLATLRASERGAPG